MSFRQTWNGDSAPSCLWGCRCHEKHHRQPEAEFRIEEDIKSIVQASPARYLVLPEGTVRLWTEATDLAWSSTLAEDGKTMLAGASLPASPAGYDNALVIFDGKHRRTVLQRIPIPGGMWNPTNPSKSFALHLFDSGIAEVGGQRVAVLICYEKLLVWPMLLSALEQPTLLVAWQTMRGLRIRGNPEFSRRVFVPGRGYSGYPYSRR